MEPFKQLTSTLVPVPTNDIDTDQIIPARFLKTTDKVGLGKVLFNDWRYLKDGSDNPDFILNQPRAEGAQVLLAGDNFGCGSSREHAPWALTDFGFRAVISTSFADIFRNNALKNGLLPVIIPQDAHEKLMAASQGDASLNVTIDLEARTIALPDGSSVEFPVDAFAQKCLLEGKDQLGYLSGFVEQIEAFEKQYEARA